MTQYHFMLLWFYITLSSQHRTWHILMKTCIFHLSPLHLNNIFDYFFSDFFSKPHKRISVCEGLYLLQSKQNLILNGNNLDYNIVAPIRRLVLLLYNLRKRQDQGENAQNHLSWGFRISHLLDVLVSYLLILAGPIRRLHFGYFIWTPIQFFKINCPTLIYHFINCVIKSPKDGASYFSDRYLFS